MENIFSENDIFRSLIASVFLLIILILTRVLMIRAVQKWPIRNLETRRKWIVQVKNTSILLFLFGLFIIWGPELKTFAVSIIAIAAAFVIATKELILCLLGGFMKAGTQMFTVGDRIEINGLRGDVIDHNLLTTVLYEIGPGQNFHHFTGRTITLPNSVFLTMPLVNETETGDFVLHVFRISFRRSEDWIVARKKLLQTAQKVCQPYLASARKQFNRIAKKEGLEAPNVEPRISISYQEPDRVDLLIRIPTPTTLKSRVEQEILNRFSGIEEILDHEGLERKEPIPSPLT